MVLSTQNSSVEGSAGNSVADGRAPSDAIRRLTEGLPTLEATLVQQLLPPEAYQQYLSGDIGQAHLKPFLAPIKELSSQYVATDGNRNIATIHKDQSSAAYALYFGLVNYWRVGALLAKVAGSISAGLNSTGENITGQARILDFGCGSGAGSLAAKIIFSNIAEITVSDASRTMLQLAASTLRMQFPDLKVGQREQGPYDLIIAANVLNEMPINAALTKSLGLFELLAPNGILLILEPALFSTTRNLMSLRDMLCANSNEFSIMYPCTHHENCPMLAGYPKDWCHGEFLWQRPRLIKQFDELLGFNKYSLKYSSLVLKKELRTSSQKDRIVFPPEYKRGAWELGLCSHGVISQKRVVGKKRDRLKLLDILN